MGDVVVYDPQGRAFSIPEGDVESAKSQGFHTEAPLERNERLLKNYKEQEYGDVQGKIAAGAAGLARGATLGLSDAAIGALGGEHTLQQLREQNPTISGVTNVVGALAPIALSGGAAAPEALGGRALLGATPTALTAKLGARIAGLGEGAGTAAKLGYAAGGAAAEGALQNAGAYISDAALGDRDLSAEGFLGSMGSGALWGGGAGGALSLAERSMLAVRRLLPSQEVTREAVEHAETSAASNLSNHMQDGDALDLEATRRLRELRAQEAARNPTSASQLANAERDAEAQLHEQLTGTAARLERGEPIGEIAGSARTPAEPFSLSRAPSEQPGYGGRTAADELDQRLEALYAKKQAQDAVIRGENRPPGWDTMTEAQRVRYVQKLGAVPEDAANAELARIAGPESEAATLLRNQQALRDSREMMERWTGGRVPGAAVKGNAPRTIGDEILDATAAKEPSAGKIVNAIGEHGPQFDHDLVDIAHSLAAHEEASAGLADTLGVRAPSGAADHAAEFRRAVDEQQSRLTDAAVASGEQTQQAAAKAPGLLQHAAKGVMHVGEVVEALHMMGVPGIPDPRNIPIIGPIAKMVLKARVLSKVFRRGPGQVLATPEAGIASKAAQTRQRVMQAVDVMSKAGAELASKAQPLAAPATILASRLFDNGKPAPETKTLNDAFHARSEELADATPQAIHDMLAKKLPTSDPSIRQAVEDATSRQLGFLMSKLPKPDAYRGLFGGDPWQPSRVEMETFAKYVAGATDPAGVIERAAAGQRVSAQEVEAVKTVYPKLFSEAQQRLAMASVSNPKSISYARRVQLGLMFELPLTRDLQPDYAKWVQGNYATKPMQQASAAALGAPTIHGNVNTGERLMPRLDKE